MPKAAPRLFYDDIPTDEPGTDLPGARSLPLGLIDPNPAQARQVFDQQALDELAQSIAQHGVLEPILVRPAGTRYTVVAGERRLRAAKAAGLSDIPAIIREMDDQAARVVGALENLQRENLSEVEEAALFGVLDAEGMTLREIAALIHKSHNYVKRRLDLLKEPGAIEAYAAGERTLEPRRPRVTERYEIEQTATDNEPVAAGFGELPAREPAPALPKDAAAPIFKPFFTFHKALQKTLLTPLTPTEQADLLEIVRTLRAELQGLEAELEG